MTPTIKENYKKRLWKEIESIRAKKDKNCKENEKEYPDCKKTCKYCGYKQLCEELDKLQNNTNTTVNGNNDGDNTDSVESEEK